MSEIMKIAWFYINTFSPTYKAPRDKHVVMSDKYTNVLGLACYDYAREAIEIRDLVLVVGMAQTAYKIEQITLN